MYRSLNPSSTRLSQKRLSEKKTLHKSPPPSQSKQFLKASYFDIAEQIFTQQILQNKRVIFENSKIRYFFGSIFYGLKKGTIRSSISDFMSEANKIFKEAKVFQIREIIAEYKALKRQKCKQEQSGLDQNKLLIKKDQFRELSKFKSNTNTNNNSNINTSIKSNSNTKLQINQSHRKPMIQINHINQQIENRRNSIVEQKQKILKRLGNFQSYNPTQPSTNYNSYSSSIINPHSNIKSSMKSSYAQSNNSLSNNNIHNPYIHNSNRSNNNLKIDQNQVYFIDYITQSTNKKPEDEKKVFGRISRRGSELLYQKQEKIHHLKSLRNSARKSSWAEDDNKLNELNNKLEYYLNLNKKHLASSRQTRQKCT